MNDKNLNTNEENEEEEKKDILDILLDDENKDPIPLVSKTGEVITFEQVAVIPYGEKIYCVLKPLDKLDYIADDEAVVFFVDFDDDGAPILMVEVDELKAIDVFKKYYAMLDKAWKKEDDDE